MKNRGQPGVINVIFDEAKNEAVSTYTPAAEVQAILSANENKQGAEPVAAPASAANAAFKPKK